jgi:light-regulated signal transduction histidine kinase (bacteriophytochrome)
MQMTGIWWYDESADALVPARQTEESTAIVGEQPRFERGGSLAWDAFESGEMARYDDLRNVPGRYNDETGLESEVIVPLGEHGVVIASAAEKEAFSETDLNLLEVLSATVEAALTRTEREALLRETKQQLKLSNEELEQFAYAASHDLQEPLRTISSYLTLLERRYSDDLDEDAREFVDFAVDGADRMRTMIQALLAYSRVDTHGEQFEDVSVTTIIDNVIQNLDVTIHESDATVTTPSSDYTISGDESQLVQLFQNLVENGIKYNEGAPRIDITASREEEMVRFEVTDNGIGIADDQADEIFEVFQRLHTREEFAGTGIGLAICRKIVERHGGRIHVESTTGEGSTFVVMLPIGDVDA